MMSLGIRVVSPGVFISFRRRESLVSRAMSLSRYPDGRRPVCSSRSEPPVTYIASVSWDCTQAPL
jgi:hypothetical protein